jgi:hypothetical protein
MANLNEVLSPLPDGRYSSVKPVIAMTGASLGLLMSPAISLSTAAISWSVGRSVNGGLLVSPMDGPRLPPLGLVTSPGNIRA